MKTRKFFMVLVALVMGSQVVVFAQDAKRPERKRPTVEQMQEMQCNQIVKGLALDDEEAAKFVPVYKKYMEEMRATHDMTRKKPEPQAEPKEPKEPEMLTDAEVEADIKTRFAQSRKMLDIREKYYEEFRKFLSPKQVQKMYNLERRNGDKFRNEMNKRKGMKRPEGRKPME